MEQAGRSKIHEAKRWLNLLRCRIMISEVVHELFIHQGSRCPQIPLKKFMKTFSWCLKMGKLKTEQKFIFLPCLDSLPYLFWRKVGTQSYSAKFLNWGNHVNSVPVLATSPPTWGIHFLIQVHNYTKVKGLDLEKITSLPKLAWLCHFSHRRK